jgi:hypothetical protein
MAPRSALAVILLLSGMPAYAQARDPNVTEKLRYVVTAAPMISTTKAKVDEVMDAARGGNASGKPLGCYVCRRKREFTSDYTHESADTVVNWTYDLHDFLSNKNNSNNLAYAPGYKLVRSFAAGWWKQNSLAFAQVPSSHQSAWIYEATLDGVQIWYQYQTLDGTLSASSELELGDLLSRYENASPSEIFFP